MTRDDRSTAPRLAPHGQAKDAVLAELRALAARDADWRGGRTFSLVYHADDEHLDLLKQAYTTFFSENALSPIAFPSLRRLEAEVVGMAAQMLHGAVGEGGVVGSMTSGGSESILLAVKTAREFAKATRPTLSEPEMLLPITAHPAFEKAAHYFGLKPVHIPMDAEGKADMAAAERLFGEHTVLVVGSAPAYPHGSIDPIAELAALAAKRHVPFHVDACLGGFLLPWLEKLGEPIPPFDFRVPGVWSISADIHKYGFAAKGASVVLYRDIDYRRHQFFVYAGWPGGLYGSPGVLGTRPGGAIAAAWACMKYLGEEGYLNLARTIRDTTRIIKDGIVATPGLRLLGDPRMSVLAFDTGQGPGLAGTSAEAEVSPTATPPLKPVDVYALGDAMEKRGWHLDRQQLPPSLHMMITPAHAPVADRIVADLRESMEELRAGDPGPASGMAAIYGMVAALPERGLVNDMILSFMDDLGKPPA